MSDPAEVQPWQRPSFEPGNTAAVRSGYKSPRLVDPIAAEILESMLSDDTVSYLREPRYLPALTAWAIVEARVALLEAWSAQMTIEQATESGQGRTPVLELLRRWHATAMTHRDRLGITPASAARLGKDVAQGRQADAAAELTRLREQHERATAAAPAEVVGDDGE